MARILIIDDNHLGLLARKSVLEGEGHEVHTTASPQRGVEICRQERFDILITDYKMPNLNGIEVIKSVRKLETPPAVILISGFTDTLGLTEANTGADVVLQKSANEVSHLIRAVNRVLRTPAGKKKPAGRHDSLKKQKSTGV